MKKNTYYKDGLVFTHYSAGGNHKAIVLALGIPSLELVDNFAFAGIYLDAGYDLFIPDYYGTARSGRKFTPENCVETIKDLQRIVEGSTAQHIYSHQESGFSYTIAGYVGLSFGGAVIAGFSSYAQGVPLGFFYPVFEYSTLGEKHTEQTVNEFNRSLDAGYKHIYRNMQGKEWDDFFDDTSKFSSHRMIDVLKNSNVFMSHGTEDLCIHVSKSQSFFDRIKNQDMKQHLALYQGMGHGSETLEKSSIDFLSYMIQ